MTLWSVLENEIGAAIRDWLQKKDRKKWEISADIDCVLEDFSRALLVFLHSVQCIRKCARNSLLNKKPQLIYLFFSATRLRPQTTSLFRLRSYQWPPDNKMTHRPQEQRIP